jgi:hypothetical protein
MGLHPHEIERPRERLKRFLRQQYRGAHQAKALAQDISCTPKAAENILDGHWPNDLHLGAIIRRFGRDVWAAVFEPEIEPVLARLTEEERQLEEALDEVRRRRRQAAGREEGPPHALATTEGSLRRKG